MRKTVVILFLFIAGCANSDFPFCCNPTGEANIPYLTTYHFDKGSGFADIGGDLSFLTIFSKGDETNLFNAANISKTPGTGALSGNVVSLLGGTVPGVILEATDGSGNKIGDLFYNSLGGIPDFSTTSGTTTSGGFTLLNAPPGDVYFKAVQGARGNGSAMAFADSVSIVNIGVFSVIQPFVGVTGGVLDFETRTGLTYGSEISPLALKGLNVSASGANFPSVTLGSDSDFIFQVSPSAGQVPAPFLTSYNRVRSDLASRPDGAVDVTAELEVFTTDFLTRIRSATGFPVNSGLGIAAGVTEDPDTTLRTFSYIDFTDDSGNLLNFEPNGTPRVYYHGTYLDSSGTAVPTWFYFKDPKVYWSLSAGQAGTIYWRLSNGQTASWTCSLGTETCPPKSVGTPDGLFVALNLPPGQIHLSAVALEVPPSGGYNFYMGTDDVVIFPGGASIQHVIMNASPLGTAGFYLPFSGQVTLPDKVTPVSFSQVYALGMAESVTVSDQTGRFSYSTSQAPFLNQGVYTLRTSASPGYVPTYQSNLSSDGTFHSLILYPSSMISQFVSAAGLSGSLDPAKGILTGMIIDTLIGRGTSSVTLEATDMAGNPVGDIRYLDTQGLPTLNQTSSKNGGYMIFNLPPGLIQVRAVSPDDSGNSLAEAYSGGVTVTDLHVNNSPPETVQVSGSTRDINGAGVSSASLAIVGEKTAFSSNNGFFSQAFSPYSSYLVMAKSAQGGMSTYNVFGTTGVDHPKTVFLATTPATLAGIAAGDPGLPAPDLVNNGVIGGTAVSYGFSGTAPIPGVAMSPIPGAASFQQRMITGLFDGDNELDLAIVNESDNTMTILLGNGDGTFHPAVGSPLCLPMGTPLLPGQTCPTGANPVAVRETDLNGDGITDLVVVNRGLDSVTLLMGTGRGNFILAASPLQLLPGSRPVGVSIEDFNKDGLTDLAVVNSGSDSFALLPGLGGFQFDITHARYFSTIGTSPVAILSRDFNLDGTMDLAILNQGSGSVSVFLGYGNGYFLPAGGSPYHVGSQPVSISAGDLNQDGYFDLVIGDRGTSTVTALLGGAGGTFFPAAGSPFSLSSPPRFVLLADLNFDNRPDLLSANANGTVSVLTGLGNGGFSPESVYAAGGPGADLAALSAIDFTDDLLNDLVAYQAGTGTLLFFTGAETPLSGVTLVSATLAGSPEGDVRYLDQSGNIITGAGATDASGRFLIFNVPPGPHDVYAGAGAAGNQWMRSYAGSATMGNILMVPPQRKSISYSGLTVNPVGAQVARNVPGASIFLLGSGPPVPYQSSLLNSSFKFPADANHYFIIELQR